MFGMAETVSVQVCFDTYFNLSKLCFDDGPGNNNYWLSWNIQDKTYKSDEFSKHDNGPPPLKNVIQFDVRSRREPTKLIPQEVVDMFPIRVLLCTHHAVLGVANVNPFRVESVEKENITSTLPFEISEWVDISPFDSSMVGADYFRQGQAAAIKVSLSITSNHTRREDDESYDGEVFENEEVEFTTTEERIEQHSSRRIQFVPKENPELKARQEKYEEEAEADRVPRHYRLSIDMRAIGGLKRPATVSLHYVYPHLGSSMPVRTQPAFVGANSETKVDNGAAVIECIFSREELRGKLADHPLKITALTKSHLGNNILGELSVDLSAVEKMPVHSYRCPMHVKAFKTLAAYRMHREIQYSMKAAGQVEMAPPRDPVVVKALDQFLVFTAPRPESRATNFGENTHKTDNNGKATPNYITPLAEGGKLRLVLILEDMGPVSAEKAVSVKPGYKMHNGAVYDRYGAGVAANVGDAHYLEEHLSGDVVDHTLGRLAVDPLARGTVGVGEDERPLNAAERRTLETLTREWKTWQRAEEEAWRTSCLEKEKAMMKKLESEAAEKIKDRAEELQKAQFGTGKLEVRLRAAIAEVEDQKTKLSLKIKEVDMKGAQKGLEMNLFQRRVRDENKSAVAEEKRKADDLHHQVISLQAALELMERRAKDSERDFEQYRQQLRNSPESVLREETAKLRAQLGECRGEVERERRLRSETELEKEHFRAQMHRLALALKREREKSSVMARQELEQLRLEFLAREERYVVLHLFIFVGVRLKSTSDISQLLFNLTCLF